MKGPGIYAVSGVSILEGCSTPFKISGSDTVTIVEVRWLDGNACVNEIIIRAPYPH
jgi:hypothetical protein